MPVALHIVLMFLMIIAGFFAGGIYGFEHREAFVEAGYPRMTYALFPMLGLFGAMILTHVLPVRCPHCRWPAMTARFVKYLYYRCWKCGHVHNTPIRAGKAGSPVLSRQLSLGELHLPEQRDSELTFSGYLRRPCTLRLGVSPPPCEQLNADLDVELVDEQGQSLVRIDQPAGNWEANEEYWPWGNSLWLSHNDWRDWRLSGGGVYTLRIRIRDGEAALSPSKLKVSLQFSGKRL